jgi:hypothetical protein
MQELVEGDWTGTGSSGTWKVGLKLRMHPELGRNVQDPIGSEDSSTA